MLEMRRGVFVQRHWYARVCMQSEDTYGKGGCTRLASLISGFAGTSLPKPQADGRPHRGSSGRCQLGCWTSPALLLTSAVSQAGVCATLPFVGSGPGCAPASSVPTGFWQFLCHGMEAMIMGGSLVRPVCLCSGMFGMICPCGAINVPSLIMHAAWAEQRALAATYAVVDLLCCAS